MIHGPGTMAFKASMKEWAGPASSSPVLPRLPLTTTWPDVHSQRLDVGNFIGISSTTGKAHVRVPYSIRDKKGLIMVLGITNAEGNTQRIFTKEKEKLDLYLGEGDWRVFIDVAHVSLNPDDKNQKNSEEQI